MQNTLFKSLAASALLLSSAFPVIVFAEQGLCQPVAYLFRHAEEKGGGVSDNNLFAVGNRHAQIYPSMIEGYQQIKNSYCDITDVYTVSIYKPDGSLGTSNPFYTAQPLAQLKMSGANPITKIWDEQGKKYIVLGEFLSGKDRDLLVRDIKAKLAAGDKSVALFWTRQGMPAAGKALYNNSYIPGGSNNPRRNSMFRFNYDVASRTFTKQSSKWVQCFNYDPYEGGFSDIDFHCLKSGSLRDFQSSAIPSELRLKDADLSLLKGKLCDSEELLHHGSNPGDLFQGYCQ